MFVRIFDSRFQHGITNILNSGGCYQLPRWIWSLQFFFGAKIYHKEIQLCLQRVSTTFEKLPSLCAIAAATVNVPNRPRRKAVDDSFSLLKSHIAVECWCNHLQLLNTVCYVLEMQDSLTLDTTNNRFLQDRRTNLPKPKHGTFDTCGSLLGKMKE